MNMLYVALYVHSVMISVFFFGKALSLFPRFIWIESIEFSTLLHSFCKRDHPYITSAKGLGGWSRKIAIFADVQYCINYADIVDGWVRKSQNMC